jgi:DNA-binding NtrC family response regulator
MDGRGKENLMEKRILIIEPSRIIRHILGVHLQLARHTIFAFATYRLASEVLPAFQSRPPEMVFVALHLAQTESCDLLKDLRSYYQDTALVALVMPEENSDRTIQTVLQETHAVTLIKPFKIQDALALAGPGQASQQQGATCK